MRNGVSENRKLVKVLVANTMSAKYLLHGRAIASVQVILERLYENVEALKLLYPGIDIVDGIIQLYGYRFETDEEMDARIKAEILKDSDNNGF